MPVIKQVELPDGLALALERRAAARSVTVEQQIVQDLSFVEMETVALAESDLMAEVRRGRASMANQGVFATDEFIVKAKAWGRK